jgi:glycerol-3-phosphate dehydrogenase (NAD(P)+)
MLDGMGLSTLKGALMSRGTREVARLIAAMGGKELSAYGLCHLGDYEATVFSKFSHNRQFGESFVKGEKYTLLAEGYYTAKAMMTLAEKYSVELPICESVYKILWEGADARSELRDLFSRSIKQEF